MSATTSTISAAAPAASTSQNRRSPSDHRDASRSPKEYSRTRAGGRGSDKGERGEKDRGDGKAEGRGEGRGRGNGERSPHFREHHATGGRGERQALGKAKAKSPNAAQKPRAHKKGGGSFELEQQKWPTLGPAAPAAAPSAAPVSAARPNWSALARPAATSPPFEVSASRTTSSSESAHDSPSDTRISPKSAKAASLPSSTSQPPITQSKPSRASDPAPMPVAAGHMPQATAPAPAPALPPMSSVEMYADAPPFVTAAAQSYFYSPYLLPQQQQQPPPQPQDVMSLIRMQVEYYFSPNNLVKDMYLRGLMDDEGYVDAAQLLTFKRLRMMCGSVVELFDAVVLSDAVEPHGELPKLRSRYYWAQFPRIDTGGNRH